MEDRWKRVDIPVQYRAKDGNGICDSLGLPSILQLDVKGACARCVVVNVFNDGKIVDGRLLQTIASYRKQTSSTNSGGINFGQYFNWSEVSKNVFGLLNERQGFEQVFSWIILDSLCDVKLSD